jgi:hypothetical protein
VRRSKGTKRRLPSTHTLHEKAAPELQAELAWKLRTQCRLLSNWVESYSSMCYQAAPGPSRLHNVVVVSVAGQLAHRCPLRELYVQLLEPLSHMFEAKTIDEYSEDDAPANIDTERPHAHCTGAATVRGRRMKKKSDAKKTIAQNRTFLRDPPPPSSPPGDNVAETHCILKKGSAQ